MKRKDKIKLIRILISSALLIAAVVCENFLPDLTEGLIHPIALSVVIFLIPYLCIAAPILKKAALNIFHGQVFDENFLMTIASIGAFITGEYPEGVFVMIFYSVGELFESIAVGKSRRSIKALTQIREDTANLKTGDVITTVSAESVEIGRIIVVKTGDRIPLDGILVSGEAIINTSALNGESLPREVAVGGEVPSGCINEGSMFELEVTKPYGETTVAKILKLVEESSERKSKSEEFITSFSRYYTPVVVILALLLGTIPPLFIGISSGEVWREWVYRALTFLVVSCPCALVISVPLAYFGGIGGASKNGVLIKGANFLDELAKCDTVMFDKTGTLTKGCFSVSDIIPCNCDREKLLTLACAAEQFSNHPIAKSLLSRADELGLSYKHIQINSTCDHAGLGVSADTDAGQILVGNEKLMSEYGIAHKAKISNGSSIFVSLDGAFMGQIIISDSLKAGAGDDIKELRREGIKKLVMLTGDSEGEASHIAGELGLDEYYASLMPWDKVERVEAQKALSLGKVSFVGDGINDAPVLTAADVGISMGALGSDAAIEASDVVLMHDSLSSLSVALRCAKKTRQIVMQNIVFALGVKLAVLILGALGVVGLDAAVFADVGVSVIAILNSMRALKIK